VADDQSKVAANTEGGGAGVVVRVDHGMCSGTRNCVRLYPEVFTVENAKAWIRQDVEWAQADTDRLQTVESRCPWGAIEVEL
jgi:uncharacterized Fe-S cluster protein YjdI